MATKISFANQEIQRLEMLRLMIVKQLEFVDAAIESAEFDRVEIDTEDQFYAHCAVLEGFRRRLDIAMIM